MSENKPHIAVRILKVLGWTVFTLVLLATAIRLSLKTTPVHNYARNLVTDLANKQINGTLSIGNISGDLWNDFSVSNIAVTQSDTLVSLDSARVQYNIWSLTNSTFSASQITISGLNANVIETADSSFNIQQLVKKNTEPAASADTSSSAFAIDIQQLELKNSNIFVRSHSYLPDSTLRVKELNASAGFSLYDEISASLNSLSFKLIEGRLPDPIAFETSGSYSDQEITLNQLVIETGRSMLRANGFSNLQDSTVQLEANTKPLSFADIQPYLTHEIPAQELQLSLKAGGNPDSLHIELRAEGEGFDDFVAISDLSFSGAPTLTKFGVSAQNIDVGYFTNDSVKANISGFQATVEGQITQDYQAMDATWGFTFYDISYQEYVFERFFGSGTIINEELRSNFQVSDGNDKVVVNPYVDKLFDDSPNWRVPFFVSNLDIGWWLQNPELTGELSFRGGASGKGYQLSDELWTFNIKPSMSANRPPRVKEDEDGKPIGVFPNLVFDTLKVNDQVISLFNIDGSINKDSLNVDGFVQLMSDRINFSTVLENYLSEKPSYSFRLNTKEFDLTEVNGLEDFPTRLNLKAHGSGTYFDPEKLELQANLLIDSSYVNGASFDRLNIIANLNNKILTVSEGELQSEVIEGSFSGRRNIENQADPLNKFNLDMQVKNLQPLASLVGAQTLGASGSITGNVTETTPGNLLFDGGIELTDINYDTLFYANSISGNTRISIQEEYGYDLSLSITDPTLNELSLQDITLKTAGTARTDSVFGNFTLDISSDDAGKITQSGNFGVNLESLKTAVLWNTFTFQTPVSLLTLQRPFNLTYQDASIQTDTLQLNADDGTYLSLAIPYADSLNQEAWAEGSDFNFGVIQEILFDERFVDGVLSGNLSFKNSPEELSGDGQLTINNLSYKGTNVDILNLEYQIISKRLQAELGLIMNGEEKVYGTLDVPFVPEDPETLGDAFFRESVSGKLVVNPVRMNEFQNILDAFEISGTEGIISFNGELSGTAGEPNFDGVLKLGDPTLSGIKIDSAFAEFKYNHLEKNVTTNAEINARGQTAASIRSRLPISVDFRTFAVNMPDETDSLSVNVVTDNFNLSVFNDFLDKQYLNRLRGVLNAEIDIEGTTGTLTPNGYLRLQDAQISVPIAGIKLTSINSELSFKESGLELTQLTARSGSGSFTASGNIALQGIIPTNLDITAKASRFRLANTADYNLTIDLDSKLTGKPTQPKASGELRVKNGFVFLQDFGEKSVEAVELEGEEVSSFSAYDSLAMDMRFVIERNFLIRNSRYLDLEIALTGELDAQKQRSDDLQLFGTLDAQRGYVRPLGKQFTLDEGTFTFSGPVEEPDLFIKTSYVPQSAQKQGDPIILYYIIEGNAEDPTFRFESQPQMEQQDIICYTLFNKPCYALESWQQVVSGSGGSTPTDLLVGVLLDEFETLATQQLGIDVVQIDNSGVNGSTSIKTGWYLNRRTFFAIVNEISSTTPETLFILEYLLTKNLDLIITQGDDNRQGIDIRWQYDY
jgi:autotransporter translocation and assembly factor TamB